MMGGSAASSDGHEAAATRRLVIASTWDGRSLAADDQASVVMTATARGLKIEIEAPDRGDPAPPVPPGPTPRLWEHEVVEVFIAGPPESDGVVPYTEIELGPHGHYLLLRLRGVREVVEEDLRLEFEAAREDGRWRGMAWVPWSVLPPTPWVGNAYTIHGPPEARRYHAWVPVPGSRPDFHRLDRFVPLDPLAPPTP